MRSTIKSLKTAQFESVKERDLTIQRNAHIGSILSVNISDQLQNGWKSDRENKRERNLFLCLMVTSILRIIFMLRL